MITNTSHIVQNDVGDNKVNFHTDCEPTKPHDAEVLAPKDRELVGFHCIVIFKTATWFAAASLMTKT